MAFIYRLMLIASCIVLAGTYAAISPEVSLAVLRAHSSSRGEDVAGNAPGQERVVARNRTYLQDDRPRAAGAAQ